MDNRHTKPSSVSVVVRGMQVRATLRHPFTPTRRVLKESRWRMLERACRSWSCRASLVGVQSGTALSENVWHLHKD